MNKVSSKDGVVENVGWLELSFMKHFVLENITDLI